MKNIAVAITYSKVFQLISVIFDIVSITYFIWASFFLTTPFISFEIFLGIYFLTEWILLYISSENKLEYIKHPLAISNILIIVGYLAAPFWNLGFLRILRALRIIHLYQLIPDIRMFTKKIISWEKIIATFVHVFVLIFIITEVVFILQEDINREINTRFDAFYFTTNAIAKVGNGDGISLVGVQGQILTLIITLISLSVFVYLIDTARKVQKIKKERKEEIYSEHICTFCDIKNRRNIKN